MLCYAGLDRTLQRSWNFFRPFCQRWKYIPITILWGNLRNGPIRFLKLSKWRSEKIKRFTFLLFYTFFLSVFIRWTFKYIFMQGVYYSPVVGENRVPVVPGFFRFLRSYIFRIKINFGFSDYRMYVLHGNGFAIDILSI